MKKRLAVFFGGRSPEHDVSVVTGLQALHAVDPHRFEAFPVYIGLDGRWWVGDELRSRSHYLPSPTLQKKLTCVSLQIPPSGKASPSLIAESGGFFGRRASFPFDVALLACHGLAGEDGRLQSLFELANVPYTGMRVLASSVFMDKMATKRILASSGIPLLPFACLERPQIGLLPSRATLEKALEGFSFPLIVKPAHLGSSIGLARVADLETLHATLPMIFRLDSHALVEPVVEDLVEYNLSVRREKGEGLCFSAIEMPKAPEALLDFRSKYLSQGKNQGKNGTQNESVAGGEVGGFKQPGSGTESEGMLSLTRKLNPPLSAEESERLKKWAGLCFTCVQGTGAPRIDFLCNHTTGEMWLNEVNPCPGSFGFFLWEAASQPLFFSDLLTELVEEAVRLHRTHPLPEDPTLPEARLFRH